MAAPAYPFCDPPNFSAIPPGQSAKDAWRVYLKEATRPYALRTFTELYWRWKKSPLDAQPSNEPLDTYNPTGDEFVQSETFWRNRSHPKARIIVLRNSGSLRVRNGRLEVVEQLPLHLSPDGEPYVVKYNEAEAARGRATGNPTMPKAIVLPEHGWDVTAEATKFCLAHGIAIVSVAPRTTQGEKGLISFVGGNPAADAALVRAQVRCKPLAIAREILRQKIETCASLGRLPVGDTRQFIHDLDMARSQNGVLYIEARAAAAYWVSRQCEVRTSSRRWPVSWATFSIRNSRIGRNGPRHADHPVNALLNWSYAVVAGRLSAELFARGACLAIGYLHVDQPGRYSLAYDALELLRPIIDEKVFKFVASTRFRMGDFLVSPSGKYKGEIRVAPELLKAFAPEVFVKSDDISMAADWLVETILANGRH
jgi:CRISPR/Cas system-associated endonuclease Cas1